MAKARLTNRVAWAIREEKVNEWDEIGQTPLVDVIGNGDHDIESVQSLIEAGADVNKCTRCGGISPLTMAIRVIRPETVRLLIHEDADVNLLKHTLFRAVEAGLVDTVQLLIESGIDVKTQKSAVFIAARQSKRGDRRSLRILIEAGADINECNSDGQSPVYIAAREGRPECLRLLIEAGADVDKCDPEGVSPLSVSTSNSMLSGRSSGWKKYTERHKECVELLQTSYKIRSDALWRIERLLWLGHRDPVCGLRYLPPELVHVIVQML